MATNTRPLLVFVGPGLTSFQQVAAVAGRRGIEVAWIGYPYSWWRRVHARAFVHKVASAVTATDLAVELKRLGPHRIVDVQASEYVLADVTRAASEAGLRDEVLSDLRERLRLADKLVMAQLLEAADIPVPATLDGTEVTASEAVERLGLPIVVKGRVATGGSAVHIVSDADAAARAADLVGTHGGAMYEAFVPGEPLSYAASCLDGEVIHDAVYRTVRVGHDEKAPPDRIITINEPEVLETGRSTVRQLRRSGLVNVNVIRQADGTARVHDVNLRPWGTVLALRESGIDFVDDYLAIHGLAPLNVLPAAIVMDRPFDVFPSAALGLSATEPIAGLGLFASQAALYAGWTGTGYVVAETVRSTGIVVRSWGRRVRGLGRAR